MDRYICIHGHFYQPPRENAWLEDVEIQDSAYPYHDWNERITAECYAPNTAARILEYSKIVDIQNNYSKMSFNFGPTLMSWMEKELPEVYKAIVDSDKLSMKNFDGHGSAISQVYNHMIMPLANRRDKQTQVIWGIKDFQYRFGRMPEGMWLSETAVDTETLEVLAENGIKFTILSPFQADSVRESGTEEWFDTKGGKVDPKRPYLVNLPSGRTISVFYYDGPISQNIGYGDMLQSGENFANRLLGAFTDENDEPQLVNIATDGETYGHHKYKGDMALAYCIYYIENNELAKITNYGQYLEMYPPQWETQIVERSAWSCSHGVERWNSDCGCNTGGHGDWNQQWRMPLRHALDWLRDELVVLYENETRKFANDPWRLRDEYIEVILDRHPENVDGFFARHIDRQLSMEDKKRLIKLLEMQRHAMLMYTSCGWFFDELSGLETTQVMQYAARATQLAFEVSGVDYETQFQKLLEKAPTNIPEFVNGSVIYDKFVKPTRLDLLRVGVHYAIASLFSEFPEETRIYGYSAKSEYFEKLTLGKMSLAVGKVLIKSEVTWDDELVAFAVIHLGGNIINGGVRPFQDNESFESTLNQIKESFTKADVPQVIRLIDDEFGHQNYSLFHLFKDEQRRVFNLILETTFEEIEHHFRTIFESDYSLIQAMKDLNIRIPKALSTPAEFVMNNDIRKMLENGNIDEDRLEQLVNEYIKFGINPDESLSYVASNKIITLIKELSKNAGDINLITRIQRLVGLISKLHLNLDLWEAQNIFFIIGTKNFDEMTAMAEKGNDYARQWLEQFGKLSDYLNVRLS